MFADDLLEAMRRAVADPTVEYAETPVRLGGGFFTENHSFRLAHMREPWNRPLVARLFPASAPSGLARREATVQGVLVDQGYAAPRVIFFDDDARLTGRRFFVMEGLEGSAMMDGIRARDLARSGLRLFTRLADVTASLQARLHRLDAAPLVAALADLPAGIERWFDTLQTQVTCEFDGLSDGLRWLVENQPAPGARPVICHGDLHPGNILTDGDRVTGVIDYSVATVAEPALDVGFTTMALCLAPIDAARPIQRAAARGGRLIAARYLRAYQRESSIDLANQGYYEALRCAVELSWVANYRIAQASLQTHDVPRPIWDAIADYMVDYFRARTGVTLQLPARPSNS